MKKFIYLFMSLCTISASAKHYGKETLESLNTSGPLCLEGTTVINGVNSSCSMKARQASMKNLFVSGSGGSTKLIQTKVKEQARVSGFFDAQDCAFGSLNVSGIVVLNKSKITDELNVAGRVDAYDVRMGSAKISGYFNIKKGAILGEAKVSGSVDAEDVSVGAAKISGSLSIKNSTISGPVKVGGGLDAKKTTFNDIIDVSSNKMVFSDSSTHSITVRKTNSSFTLFGWSPFDVQKEQVVELRDGTMVNGSITFESGQGKVYVYGNSKITGTVKGGIVIKK